jgi:hypothetical protein
MVATTQMNKRLDEVYRRRSEILPTLAASGPESVAAHAAFLEEISRPGDLGGPNPREPVAVRIYEAELSLMLLEVLAAQQERISELEEKLPKRSKAGAVSAKP